MKLRSYLLIFLMGAVLIGCSQEKPVEKGTPTDVEVDEVTNETVEIEGIFQGYADGDQVIIAHDGKEEYYLFTSEVLDDLTILNSGSLIYFTFEENNDGRLLLKTVRTDETTLPLKKQVTIELEGNQEQIDVTLKQGNYGYVIYIDEERYKFSSGELFDEISADLGGNYPDVSMTITEVENTMPEELAGKIYDDLKESFITVNESTPVTEPIEGLLLVAEKAKERSNLLTRVYVVSNEKEGSFIIRQNLFLEAAEGHGARFDEMLKEFKVVKDTE